MQALLTRLLSGTVVLSAVQKKTEYVEQIMLFNSIFLFSYCENLVLLLAEHFLCAALYEWEWCLQCIFSSPLRDACCSVAQPWSKDGLLQKNCLPCPLHISHTQLLHYQGGGGAHVHTHTHAGLKALTGLLAKGQSQESHKSFFREMKTSHIQLNWKYTCSYFLLFLYLYLSFSSLSPVLV